MSLTVTDRAAAALKETLDSLDHQPEETLRLVPRTANGTTSELGLALDESRDGDQVVDYDGETVMVIDDGLSEALSAATLDLEEGPQGPALTLK